MSMNIHIHGEREVTYPSGFKQSLSKSFNCLQTPTKITEEILASSDPIQAYKNWVLSLYLDEQQEIHDFDQWDSSTHYYKVIGYKPYNFGKEHCEKLEQFISDMKCMGFVIDIYSM